MFGFNQLGKGVVCKFNYPQAQREPGKFVKILSVRDTKKNPILSKSYWNNPDIERGRYLVTATDTRGVVRNYYPEICDVIYIAGPLYKAVWHVRKWLHV